MKQKARKGKIKRQTTARCNPIGRHANSTRTQPFPTKRARLAPVQPGLQTRFVECMMTSRTQYPYIATLELRHANRTLFHGHAKQDHLQLDTPVPRHPLPHQLDLAHETRRTRIILKQTPNVRVIVWRRHTDRRGWRRSRPKEVRNKQKRLGRRMRSCRTSRDRRQSENSRHN